MENGEQVSEHRSKIQRIALGAVSALFVFVFILYGYKVATYQEYTDFSVYYREALRVQAQQWAAIYSTGDGASPFRYAPPFLLFFRPFAELSSAHARLAWFFIQYFCFGLSFFIIYLSLSKNLTQNLKRRATVSVILGILYILRFCLDTFTIGQVSGLMFLGFSLGLSGYISGRPIITALGILIPTGFKIGPGILYGSLFSKPRAEWFKTFVWAGVFSGIVVGISSLWFGSWELVQSLWLGWVRIVRLDSSYFDSSHYGSQSLNSFLLRLVKAGWLTLTNANSIHLSVTLFISLALLVFWMIRRPLSALGRGLFYSLGLFAYIWLMPETFKYSLTVLAIPVILLFVSDRKSLLTWIALILGVFTLSIAGKDVVGDFLFFRSQIESIPFFSTLLLGAATLQLAWRESSGLKRTVTPTQTVFAALPPQHRTLKLSAIIIRQTGTDFFVQKLARSIEQTLKDGFEILVFDSFSEAIRNGIHESRGEFLIFCGSDYTGFPEFVSTAFQLHRKDIDLVKSTHGHLQSRICSWFKIPPTDIFTGRIGVSWRLARHCYAIGTDGPGFGLELSLLAQSYGYQEILVPEFASSHQHRMGFLFEFWRIWSNFRKGTYRKLRPLTAVTADDWGLSPGINDGIIEMAQMGIVKRISMMANCPFVTHRLDELLTIPGLELGLHFNLTHGHPLAANTAPPLVQISGPGENLSFLNSPFRLFLQWLYSFGNHKKLIEQIRNELIAQLDKLRALGVQTRYLDGHQHTHMLPGLINHLAATLKERKIITVRLPLDWSLLYTKRAGILILVMLVRASFKRNGIRSLPCFYPTEADFLNHGRFRARLSKNPDLEVIVHPAKTNDMAAMLEFPDGYTAGRLVEYQALRVLALVL